MVGFSVVSMIGFLLMVLFMGDNQVPMLIAGFCIGTGDAMMSVGLPLVTRACYGDRRYGEIYSYMNMPIAILGGIGATFVAMVDGRLPDRVRLRHRVLRHHCRLHGYRVHHGEEVPR